MTQSTQSIVSRDICMPTTTTLYDTFYTVHRLPRQMYADNYYTVWHNLHSPSSPETDVCRQLPHFMTHSTQSIVSQDRCMPTTTTLYDTIYTVHRLRDRCMPTTTTLYDTIYTVNRLPRRMYAYNYYTLWNNLHNPSSPETDVCRQLLHFMTQSTQSIVSRDGCMPTTTTFYDTIYTAHRLPRRMYADKYYSLWHNLHSPSSPETDVCLQLLHSMTQSTQSIVSQDRCMPTTTTLYDTIHTVHRLPRPMYADNYYTLWHNLHNPSSTERDVCRQLLHFMTQSTQSIVSRVRCMPTTTTLYDTFYTVHRLPRQMYADNYYTVWHNLHSPSSPETYVCRQLPHFMTHSTQSIVSQDRCMPTTTTLYETIYTVHRLRDRCMPTTTTLYDIIYTVHRLPRRMYAYNYYTLWHNLHSPSTPETDVCLQLLHFMTQSTQSIVSRDRNMPTTTTLYYTFYTVHRLPRQMYAYNYYTLWHNLHSPSSPETDVCRQLPHFMTHSTQSIVSQDRCMPTTTTLYDTIYTVHRLRDRCMPTTTTLYDIIYTVHRLPRRMYAYNYYTLWHNLHSPFSPETDVCRQLLHFMTQSTQSFVSRDGCMPTTTTLYKTNYTAHRLPRRMYADNYYILWHNLHSPSSPETDVCLQLLHSMTQSTQSIVSRDRCMPTTTTLYDTIYTVHRLRDRCMPTTTTLYDTIYTVNRLPRRMYAYNYYTLRHNLHSPSSPETNVCRQLLHFMTQSTQSIVSRDKCMPTTTTLYDTIYTVHRLPRQMNADNYYTLWHNLHSPSSPETYVFLQLLHFITQSTQSIVSRERCMPTTTTLYDTIYTVHRLPRRMYADNYYTLWHNLQSPSSPEKDVCLQLLHFMTQSTQSIVSRDGCMPTTTTLYDTIYTVHRLPRRMYADNYYTLWHNLHSPSSPETDVCLQLLHFMTQSTQSIFSRDGCMPTTTTLYDTIYTVHRLPRRMYAYNYYTLWHNLHSPSSPETDVCRQLLHFMTQSTQSIVSRDRCIPTTTKLYDTIYTVHCLPRRMYADNYYTLWHNLHSPSSPETDVCLQLLHFMTQSTQPIVSRDECMPTTTTIYDTIYTVHRLPRQMYAYNYYTLWHNLHSPSTPETDVCRQLLHFMTQSTQSIVSRDRCIPTTTTLYDTIYTVHRLPREMYAYNYYSLLHNLHSPSSPETDVCRQLLHFMTQSTQSIVYRERCMPTTTTFYNTIYTVHRLPR